MWTTKGLARGLLTTPYPRATPADHGATPPLPIATSIGRTKAAVVDVCPTGALMLGADVVDVDLGRCIACQRCRLGTAPMEWKADQHLARHVSASSLPGKAFRHSLHVRVVDAGDGGETLRELKQLTSPYYAAHRLGIFFTPTPRGADVLLVVGPVTQGTRQALLDTYRAMPEPKWVLAVGSGAVSGVPFGPSFTSASGVGDVLPVDIVVPGDPPPPLAILDGLLSLMGRVPAQELRP